MRVVTLLQPPRLVFGNGCASGSVELLSERGFRRVLLVSTTPVMSQLGVLRDGLEKAGCEVTLSPPVDLEPTVNVFESILGLAKARQVEAVLGIGGGSALDAAKLVAAFGGDPARSGHQRVTDAFGINRLAGRGLFLVCLPTTAGTGSEVSPNAILLDEADQAKKAVVSPHLVPDAVFTDPLLTVSVPPPVTAATGLDALTHCIEAYANTAAHPMVDLYALDGIRLISRSLLQAVQNGADIEARVDLCLGSLYGGQCLGPVNTAAVHALAYPLGGRFHVAHGVSNAVLLPPVLRFNLVQAPERYAQIARALGVVENGSAMDTAERGVAYLTQLSRACGIPQRLSELGVPREAIPALAQAALQVTRLLKNNLRPITAQDAVCIYESVY